MRYLRKNKRGNGFEGNIKRARGARSLLIISIIILAFVLVSLLSPDIVPGKLNDLGKPIWIFREFIISNIADFKEIVNSKSFLVVENRRLQQELDKAKTKLVKTNLLERENNELKNIVEGKDDNKIIARVLSKANQSPYGTLIIDIDNNVYPKISIGHEVFSENSILIGTIDNVYENTARVKLLSAPGNKYDVEIGSESIPAIAEGLGSGNFKIELPRGVDIKVGDEVISPALSIKLLGIVEYIDATPQNSIQKILFKSPVNINQIKWVLIENE